MLTFLGILLAIGWLVSPIVLAIMYGVSQAKRRKAENVLRRLYYAKRAALSELIEAGIDPASVPRDISALPHPAERPVNQPPQTVQTLPPPVNPPKAAAAQELEKLEKLRADGALTEEEFGALAKVQQMRLSEDAKPIAAPVQPASLPEPAAVSAEKSDITPDITPDRRAESKPAVPSPLRPAVKEAEFVPPAGKPEIHISAITAMLSVGVVLIVFAGLLLVRSNWSTMSNGGRLMLLGAGSVLFFGTSWLARHLWKLERTGMAFFTLGAAFLPISIWAAGYFDLLGSGLGGADNPWTASLAFASFTVIALIALRMYDQIGWAVGALMGGMLCYLYFAGGLFWDTQRSAMLIAAAIPAAALCWCCDRLQMRLPETFSRAIVPFTVIYTACAAIAMTTGYLVTPRAVCGLAALICAAAFLSPLMTGILRNGTAVPVGLELVVGFSLIFSPLLGRAGDTETIGRVLETAEYLALIAIASAAVILLLGRVGAIPEEAQDGFSVCGMIFTGAAVFLQFTAVTRQFTMWARLSPALLIPALLFTALIIAETLHRQTREMRICAAVQSWVLCLEGGALVLANQSFARGNAVLLAGGLAMLCFVLFYVVKRLRSAVSDLLLPLTAATFALSSLTHAELPLWRNVCGYVLCAGSAAVFWLLAAEKSGRLTVRQICAVCLPLYLGAAALVSADHLLKKHPDIAVLGWAMLSLCAAAVTYFVSVKKAGDAVHRLMFWLCTAPPVLLAALGLQLYDGDLLFVHEGICIVLCWVIAALHGKDSISRRALAVWWPVLLAVAGIAAGERRFSAHTDWVVLCWAGVSLLLAGLAFLLIRRKNITPRRWLFWAAVFPPAVAAVFGSMLYNGDLFYLHALTALVLCTVLALTHWTERPVRYILAALSPLILFVTGAEAYYGRLSHVSDRAALLWSVTALAIGAAVWYPKKLREDAPCRVLYALFALPPMLAACVSPLIYEGELLYLNALICVLLCYAFALAFDRKTPLEFSFAALLPVILFVTANYAADNRFRAHTDAALLLWTALSIGIALTVYFTTRRRFHAVRQTLFALCAVPPLIAGFFAHDLVSGDLLYVQKLVCAAFALMLWLMFASRGFKRVSTGAFACSVLLICNTAGAAAADKIFGGHFGYPVAMIAGLWIMLMSVGAVFIARRLLIFVGADAIPRVMQLFTPLSAMYFAMRLLALNVAAWQPIFFLYAAAFCVLGWLVTRPQQIILPGISAAALYISLEALRRHFTDGSNGRLAIVVFCFAALTLLFPYLGVVAREGVESAEDRRRSYVLTAAGGFVPLWVLGVSWSARISAEQHTWLRFFVPVLAAGFLLHFVFEQTEETLRKRLVTAAAVCCTAAFWLQPVYAVQSGSYWDGKLHLLPLIAFGVVIRKIYGARIGENFLFAIGVYAILRIAGSALMYEKPADLVTILALGLSVFIVSFFVKQKKWFLLGGATLIGIAVYLRMKLFIDIQWWVWLLLAGILLIAIAATNEMLRARGDSLKERAGRLWEDWQW